MQQRNNLLRKTPLKRRKPMRQKRSRPRRSGRVRDRAYLLAVKGLPCCLVGTGDCSGPIEADHAGRRPLGRKCNDDEAIPLCRKHHRDRTDALGFFRGMFIVVDAAIGPPAITLTGFMREWCDRRIAETRARLGYGRAA